RALLARQGAGRPEEPRRGGLLSRVPGHQGEVGGARPAGRGRQSLLGRPLREPVESGTPEAPRDRAPGGRSSGPDAAFVAFAVLLVAALARKRSAFRGGGD